MFGFLSFSDQNRHLVLGLLPTVAEFISRFMLNPTNSFMNVVVQFLITYFGDLAVVV